MNGHEPVIIIDCVAYINVHYDYMSFLNFYVQN